MSRELAELSWPVRTERLSIRPAEAGDAEAVWNYRRDPETSRWLTTGPAGLDTFRQHFAEPARLAKTLVIERDSVIMGDLMIAVEDAWAQYEVRARAVGVQAEIGWCLSPGAVGQGYAQEAVRAVFAICFESLGLRRVVANCFARNEASARLMRRLGMREEIRTRADSLHRDGQWMDGLGFALLADEWRAASSDTEPTISAADRSAGSR